MIAFGCVVSSEEIYQRRARATVRRFAEPDAVLVERRGQDCLYRAYNDIVAQVSAREDLEALVLLHQDVSIVDAGFSHRLREQLRDPRVAVLGTVGASAVRGIAWWEGKPIRGHVKWDWLQDPDLEPYVDPEMFSLGSDDVASECDAVDGLILVLSAWAARNLHFDETLGPSFHGYDIDICFQARAAGKLVVAAPLPVVHHTPGEFAPAGASDWVRVHQAFARKWGL